MKYMLKFLNLFKSAPHIPRLPDDVIDSTYNKLRWQVFVGVIIGYMSFYFIRFNFSLAIPYLIQQGFTKTQVGFISAIFPITYGIGRLLMSIISDYSNPKYFMTTGLLLSTIINFLYGSNIVINSFLLMVFLMFINGWAQSMGWPALVKIMVNWFDKKERGSRMSIINTMQNFAVGIVGPATILGISIFNSWRGIFYFPAMITACATVIIFVLIHDTPQSKGLPSIEEYRGDLSDLLIDDPSQNPSCNSFMSGFFSHVFTNRKLWFLSLANMGLYFICLGTVSWTPTYLREIKGFSSSSSCWAFMLYEYAGVLGTIFCGWVSDKYFSHNRIKLCIFYMIAISFAVLLYWAVPPGNLLLGNIALISLGFFVFAPMTIISVSVLDLIPKRVTGAAIGLVGFFGHVGGGTLANVGLGAVAENFGWNSGFAMLFSSCIITIIFLLLTLASPTPSPKYNK